jgi:tripartite ATP-independent transporter DctP family solute receptor
MAHEPAYLFRRAAEHFASEIDKSSKGQMKVEVLTVKEYADRYAGGKNLHAEDITNLLSEGKLEMSQTYTTSLGALSKDTKDMYVLDMPFLFRDHQHARAVLEGETGQRLLAKLSAAGIKGLAFTYSGGYRVIPSTRPIHTLEDMKGMSIRTSVSPVAQDTFSAVGAVPTPMDLEDVGGAVKQKKIEGAESTYPRFYSMKQSEFSTVLNDTHHSLFLTSVIMNNNFWSKLSPERQKMVQAAALSAARLERAESIEDAEKTKERCKKDGIQVVELPKQEIDKFKTAMKPIYAKYANYFEKGLIDKIRKQ